MKSPETTPTQNENASNPAALENISTADKTGATQKQSTSERPPSRKKRTANVPTSSGNAPRKKWPRRLGIAVGALAIAALVAFGVFAAYASDYYRAGEAAQESLTSTELVNVEQGAGYVALGNPDAAVGFVFYPGAKVEYTSYAPLLRDLANRGYFTVAVEMPFNFAFFDIAAADRIRAAYPQVKEWWVGGHSLGGSMAAQYAADHANDEGLAGVVFLGSYPASDLSKSDLGIVSVYGSNDLVLNKGKLAESTALMPSDALVVKIEGGNHAQFGDYGVQAGDGAASISPTDQQEQTAEIIDAYVSDRGAKLQDAAA